MAHNPFEQFKKAFKTISRDEKDVSRMREFLSEFADLNPARIVSGERFNTTREHTVFSSLQNLTKRYMGAIASLLIVLLTGGGVAVAAEQAVPGDALYSVKVEVNENVKSVLEIGAENDADWDIRQAERRVEEAIRLTSTGELDTDTRVHLEEKIEAHTQSALDLAMKLDERGNATAAMRVRDSLDARIEAYDNVLALLESKSENISGIRLAIGNRGAAGDHSVTDAALMARVEDDGEATEESATIIQTENRISADAKASVDFDIENYMKRVRNTIDEAEDAVEDAEGTVKARAEVHLEVAVETYVRAEEMHEAGENDRAVYAHLTNAYRAALRAKVMAEHGSFISFPDDERVDESARDREDTRDERGEVEHSQFPVEIHIEGNSDVEVEQNVSDDESEVQTHIRSEANTGGNTGSSETTGDAEARVRVDTFLGF